MLVKRGGVFYLKILANEYEPKIVMKMIREWTEKTQTEFGNDLGFSKMTIQGYERGLRSYTFDTLVKIANAYGLTITIEKR